MKEELVLINVFQILAPCNSFLLCKTPKFFSSVPFMVDFIIQKLERYVIYRILTKTETTALNGGPDQSVRNQNYKGNLSTLFENHLLFHYNAVE